MVHRGNQTANPRESGLLLRRTTLMVLALDTVRATGALGYAHSILCLGFATIGSLSGRYTIGILLGNSRVARVWVGGGGSLTIFANGLTARVLDAILLCNHIRSKQNTRQQ